MAELQILPYGCALVRANGKGISTINDAYGRRIAAMNNLQSNKRILMGTIPLMHIDTLYVKIGNILMFLIAGFLIFIVLKRIRPETNANGKEKKPTSNKGASYRP